MLTSPELITLARRINQREEAIELLKKKAIEGASEAVTEALLQGQDLIAAKARCAHGTWEAWIKVNCPKLSYRTAARYMALAAKLPRVAELQAAGTLRAALALCELEGEQTKAESKQWPPYLEAIGRLSKVIGYVERHPIEQWPSEGRDKLREDLKPIVAALWPDKFE